MVRISSTRPPRQREDRELALGYQSRPPWCAIVRRGIGLCVQAIWVKRRKSEARSRERYRHALRSESFRWLVPNARIEDATRIKSSFGNRDESFSKERRKRREKGKERIAEKQSWKKEGGGGGRGVSLVRKLERQTCRYENFNRLC